MKTIAACFLLLLLNGCVNDKEEAWNLVWSDEFDIPGLPECGEIDIMEHINNEDILYGTLHWYNDKHVMNGDKTPCDVTKYHPQPGDRRRLAKKS
jgi:hypothetical protein